MDTPFTTEIWSSDISDIAVSRILDPSEKFDITVPGIYLTNSSVTSDNSVATAHFNVPKNIISEYLQHPTHWNIENIVYGGNRISINPKLLTYELEALIQLNNEYKKEKEDAIRSIDPDVYEAVFKHYLTECVSKVLPKIVNGVYLSDNKPLTIGEESKDCPGLFLAVSEDSINELVKDKIISHTFNFDMKSYDNVFEIDDYLKMIEKKDGICLVTKNDSGVNIALNRSLLHVGDIEDFEKYFSSTPREIGAKTTAAIYAATFLKKPMKVLLIKQSTCNELGVGKLIELNQDGVVSEVCIEYSPSEANKKLSMENGYRPKPEDISVVTKKFIRDEQNRLLEDKEKTTITPLSEYYDSWNFKITEESKEQNLFDAELLNTGY